MQSYYINAFSKITFLASICFKIGAPKNLVSKKLLLFVGQVFHHGLFRIHIALVLNDLLLFSLVLLPSRLVKLTLRVHFGAR